MANYYRPFGAAEVVAAATASTSALITAFLQKTPTPSDVDIAQLLRLIPVGVWKDATRSLIEAGVPVGVVQGGAQLATSQTASTIKNYLTVASAAVSAYHGVKRNDSLFWGACWFLLGLSFPVFTPVAALALGFAKRKS